jgi:hypothetical protein
MTAAPAWNTKPGLTTDWAEDVEEEEAKQGKIEVCSAAQDEC